MILVKLLNIKKFHKLSASIYTNYLKKLGIIKEKSFGTTIAEIRGDKLYLYDSFFKYNKKIQKHILAHELGHVFQNANDISILDLENHGFSIYEYEIMNNPMEGFAEGFAFYITKPTELKSKYPEQFKIMKKWVGNTKPIKDFINKIVRKELKKLPYNQVFKEKDFDNIDLYV